VRKVVIDCDPGHDDVFAIGLASRRLEIVGITTVCGNSSIENTTRNALVARDVFSLGEVPIVVGASKPLNGVEPQFTTAHGSTGLDGPVGRTPKGHVAHGAAHDFLIEQSKLHEDLWIIAIGPLTNVALALSKDPDFARRVAGISIMGGSASFGNVTSSSEYNTWFDPEAADVVFGSQARLMMCGLDLTHQFALGPDFAESLRAIGSDPAIFCAELFDFYYSYSERLHAENSAVLQDVLAPLHDLCAVLAITNPEIFGSEEVNVEIELAGTITRGMTVVDRRPWMKSKNVNVNLLVTIDSAKAAEIVLDSFVR